MAVLEREVIRQDVLGKAIKDYSEGVKVKGSELSPDEIEELAKSMRDPVQIFSDWLEAHLIRPSKKTP